MLIQRMLHAKRGIMAKMKSVRRSTATRIQKHWRRILAQYRYRRLIRPAVYKIQRVTRARQDLQHLRTKSLPPSPTVQAKRIQRVWRGFRTRVLIWMHRTGALRYRSTHRWWAKTPAATKIQCAVRCIQARATTRERLRQRKIQGPGGGAAPAAEPPALSDTLPMNRSLSQGKFLLSSSGRYKAIMQADGNLCVYAIYEGGLEKFRYGTMNLSQYPVNVAKGEGAYAATMQADGNLTVTWAPIAKPTAAEFKFGTVQAGHYEPSAKSKWHAVMQDDGNLVVYGGDKWEFGTVQHGGYEPELLPRVEPRK